MGGWDNGRTIDERANHGAKLACGTTLDVFQQFIAQIKDRERGDPVNFVEALGQASRYDQMGEPGLYSCELLRIVYVLMDLANAEDGVGDVQIPERLRNALANLKQTFLNLFSKNVRFPDNTRECCIILRAYETNLRL